MRLETSIIGIEIGICDDPSLAAKRNQGYRALGNQTWLKEVSREMWSSRFIETLIQDLRYCARNLLKQPGFTLLAVLTLALGIGSTTTIFSAIHNILLDPFPYTDAHRMVAIQIHDTSNP